MKNIDPMDVVTEENYKIECYFCYGKGCDKCHNKGWFTRERNNFEAHMEDGIASMNLI